MLVSHFPGSPGNPINLSFTVILTTVFLNVTEVPASLNLNPMARPHRVCSASSTGQVLWSDQAGHTQLEEAGLPEALPPLLGLWVHGETVGPWWGAGLSAVFVSRPGKRLPVSLATMLAVYPVIRRLLGNKAKVGMAALCY